MTNRSGVRLANAIVASSELGCLDLGTIADGATVSARDAVRIDAATCADETKLTPAWRAFEPTFAGRTTSSRPTLLGELELPFDAADTGFRVEQRTILIRVVGGAS